MNKGLKKELVFLFGTAAALLFATRNRRAAAAVGAGTLLWALKKEKDELTTFRGKTAVITGGSRGLGLALAEQLILEGARVTLLARDEKELEAAKIKLISKRSRAAHDVHILPCDVTNPEEISFALKDSVEHWGGLDLLVNNAGAIIVGPFDSMTPEDFEVQWKLHVMANVHATKAVLPYFRAQGGGRIINICSMGGKAAVPHMLPYDTSKFALAGFSQGLAAELAHENIAITTAYPTLMRTGSPIQAVFKGDAEKEFSWFATADNMPLISMEADVAAKKILQASKEKRTEFIPSFIGKARQAGSAFFPETLMALMGLMGRLMPKGTRSLHRTGAQSETSKSYLPGIGKRAHEAESEWNQTPSTDAKHNLGYDPRH